MVLLRARGSGVFELCLRKHNLRFSHARGEAAVPTSSLVVEVEVLPRARGSGIQPLDNDEGL